VQGRLAAALDPSWRNTNPGGDTYGSFNPQWERAGQLLMNRAAVLQGEAMGDEPLAVPASGGIAQRVGAIGIDTVQDFITANPLAAGATALGLAGAVGATVYATTRKPKRKSSRRRKAATSRSRSPSRRRKSRLKFGSPAWRKRYMRKGRKRIGTAKQYRRKGGKAVKYTAKGQPYIILANGKARFVKK